MFKKEDYSKLLPRELVKILKEFTSKKDVTEVSRRTNIGAVTVDRVRRGENPLTNNNCKAIEELMYIAKTNAKKTKFRVEKALEYLK